MTWSKPSKKYVYTVKYADGTILWVQFIDPNSKFFLMCMKPNILRPKYNVVTSYNHMKKKNPTVYEH